jgi:hypothetical protein
MVQKNILKYLYISFLDHLYPSRFYHMILVWPFPREISGYATDTLNIQVYIVNETIIIINNFTLTIRTVCASVHRRHRHGSP